MQAAISMLRIRRKEILVLHYFLGTNKYIILANFSVRLYEQEQGKPFGSPLFGLNIMQRVM